MEISLLRYNHDRDSTQGLLAVNGSFFCHTLEDEHRDVKLKGETCIPEGRYEVVFNKRVTPMTEKYRKRFKWFDYHLMLVGVPNFKWVYIHIGNDDDDTDGCILVADESLNDPKNKSGWQSKSTEAFTRFYKVVSLSLKSGERVFININSIMT